MLAFSLEQCHQLEEAEDSARRSLSLTDKDPWAQHALAHVLETQGRVDEGIDFLETYCGTWSDRSVFIRGHNWWHKALFHLDRDEHGAALKIFDEHLWGDWPEFSQEQIGAVSCLWRLELRDVDVGDRWVEVAEKVRERELEHLQPFHDLHYVYALARADFQRDLARFLDTMEAASATQCPPHNNIWREVALPAARGVVAHALGRHDMAGDELDKVIRKLQCIGGSHAQRDLFVQTWIDAMLNSGRKRAAADVLKKRLEARPNIAVTGRLLSRADQAYA
jgi:tetratricopeptide (TPR) repeat protein